MTLNPSVDHALFLDKLQVGDTNRVLRTERDAGGKGVNLSRVVAELGAETMATGFVGGGPGDYVRGVLDRQGVKHCFVTVKDETRVNFSVEDRDCGPPTTFNERGPNIQPGELQELLDCIEHLLPKVTWIAMGGSLPPGVPLDIFATITQMAHQRGVRAAVDADGDVMALALKARPDFIKPNAKEAGRLLNRIIHTVDDAAVAARDIDNVLGDGGSKPVVVISLGERGAVMSCESGVFLGESPQVQVRSTIGSGDSMIAGILWAIESGLRAERALKYGLACGAATATTNGSEIARKPMIDELLPKAVVHLSRNQ